MHTDDYGILNKKYSVTDHYSNVRDPAILTYHDMVEIVYKNLGLRIK